MFFKTFVGVLHRPVLLFGLRLFKNFYLISFSCTGFRNDDFVTFCFKYLLRFTTITRLKTVTRLMRLDSEKIKRLFSVTEVITAISFFFVKNIQATCTFSDIAIFIAVKIFEILLLICQGYSIKVTATCF